MTRQEFKRKQRLIEANHSRAAQRQYGYVQHHKPLVEMRELKELIYFALLMFGIIVILG